MMAVVRYDCSEIGQHFGKRNPKTVREGTHRSQPFDYTLERVLRLAPIMGITRVANVTGLDAVGIPVVMVCRPNSRSVAVSQGKGFSFDAARASGLMEAAELYHAETITLPLRLCTYEELRYEQTVVEIKVMPQIAGSRFHRDLRLLWCEGRDLLTEKNIFVPYEMVHTDYTIPLPSGHGCFPASSNGLASGNCLTEAISHGICEVIERDATTLWRLRGEKRFETKRLLLDSVDDVSCRELIDKLENSGLAVGVWEITSDIGIAAFACILVPRSGADVWHASTSEGYGCHPAREIALARALMEAAQARLTVISGVRDDFRRDAYQEWLDPIEIETLQQSLLQYLPTRRYANVPNYDAETLEDDLACELESIRAAGVQNVVVINLTRAEFGLPVVRVIIPGLEPALGPGYRLGPRARRAISDCL